jgi:hypothetical protein
LYHQQLFIKNIRNIKKKKQKKETIQSLTPEMVLQSVLELRKELKISSETTDKILAELFTAAYR